MRRFSSSAAVRAVLLLSLVTTAACDNTTEPSTPSSITVATGSAVTGRAGEAKPVTVTVLTSNGKALGGTPITFTVSTGGGTVTPATATTDANGQASTSWTLGNTLGAQVLMASASGITQTIIATVSAGAPATVSISAGANQTAAVNTPVPTPPAVLVRDAGGNPVSGVTVSFASTPSGTVTPSQVTTDASGIARAGIWTLGPQAGTYTLQATVLSSGVTGNPLAVTATATAGPATRVDLGAGLTTSAAAGTVLTGSGLPSVVVRDANGNPVQGATVTFTASSGGGTVTGGTQTTNAQGIAMVGGFTLGQTAGANIVTATVAGAGSVSIAVTGTAGAASASSIVSGNSQSIGAGQTLPVGPSIRVVDRFGNPVAGVPVTFVVTSGGGSLLGAGQTTNASGIATVGGVTLGVTPGPNTIVARVAGLPDVVFTATGLAGAPATITRQSPEFTSVITNTAQNAPIRVAVRDANGFAVQGAVVNFSVVSGAGALSSSAVTTDASGQAAVTFTGGGTLGDATINVSAPGIATGITFTVSVQRATPTAVVLVQGSGQTATVGSPLAVVPTVRVTDANGRPVPGVEVQFRIVAGGGSVDIPVDTTDANGLADPGQYRVGGVVGLNQLGIVVSEPFVTGNPVTVIAQAIAAPTSVQLSIVQGNAQTAPAGSILPIQPTVLVRDANGNVLAGVTVQFLPSGPTATGTVSQQFVQTDGTGQARVTWRLDTTAGTNTLTAVIVGTSAVIQFTAQGQ